MQFQQAQCARFPETLFCKALQATQKTLYKVEAGKICGQVAISADYEKYVEELAGFQEGTCTAQGFSHADGSKTVNVPIVGEIDVALFDNVLEEADANQKTLYKVEAGKICGQVAIGANYEKYVEEFTGFQEGTCAAQGFSHADGAKTLKVPIVGEVDVALFDNVLEEVGGEDVTLFQITGTECGQSTLPKKYESYAQKFDKELKEGTCADHGYTVADGAKDITVPFIGTIHTAEFKKPAADLSADKPVNLWRVIAGIECEQMTVDTKYESWIEKADAKLAEGTCADQGFTLNEVKKTETFPMIGDVEIQVFSKPAVGVSLYQVDYGVCAEATIDKQFESVLEHVDSSLKEGTCASAGFTKEDGQKDVKVPFVGDIKFALYTKAKNNLQMMI